MTKMIINADDFGYSRAVNYGILDAYLCGVLTSATLMVNQPGTVHGCEIARKYPGLKIGLHLNVALGKPLTDGKTLVGEDGKLIKPQAALDFGHYYEPEEVYEELKAQYIAFTELMGMEPTHLDSHLFSTDKLLPVAEAARRLAVKFGLPLRNHDFDGQRHVEFITFRTFHADPGLGYLKTHFSEICSHESVEIMSHPAHIDSRLLKESSYNVERCAELDILCSPWLKKLIEENQVEMISYVDV